MSARETVNGPSLEILKRRLDKDGLELEEFVAKAEAYEALSGIGDPLLVKVARALLLGELISDPLQAAQINGDRIMRTNPTHSDPGASTRVAREQDRRLRKNLTDAVERFNQAIDYWNDNDGKFPPRPPRDPQVRCGNDRCSAVNKRIPKYVGPRGVMIELTHCPKCGNKLKTA